MSSVKYKVYCFLLLHKDLAEQGHITIPEISRGVGCSQRSAARVLKILEKKGVFRIERNIPNNNKYIFKERVVNE